MSELTKQQINQEVEYEYPYHFLPTWDGKDFSQTKSLAWGYEYLSYLYFVLDKVDENNFDSLLDVGCGDGRFLFEVNRKFSGKKLAGIDFSKRAINFAKIMTPEVEWVCGDINDENIFHMEFDIITLIETLEHINPEEIKNFLRGIHKRLKEDGTFIVTVPSKNIRVSQKHYQHFDLDSLTEVLSPFFSVIDVNYLNRKSSLSRTLINEILANRLFYLRNRKLLKKIYTFYLSHHLHMKEDNCRRIAVVCKKNRLN